VYADSETPPPDTTADTDAEVTRLRTEVSALNARLDTRRRRASAVRTARRVTAAVLIAVSALALTGSVVSVWSARTVFNTDRWVATVTPLPQNPQVATAVAEYTTDQVFQALNVEQRLRTVLPKQAAFVAGPIASQVQDTVRKTVTGVLQSDRFQGIWAQLNRRAHERALAIINGDSDLVVTRENRVDIDLLPLINQVLRGLSAQLPSLFGRQISLPDLSSGAIPDNLRSRVQQALGVTLPANFAQFTVYDSGQLRAIQRAVTSARRDIVLFVVGTCILLILALAVSPGRRRTLLQFGLWLVVAAVAVTAVLRAVRGQLLETVPAGVYRDGAAAALGTVLGGLRTRGVQLIWGGALLAAVMYLIGPGRGPTSLRRHLAAGTRVAGRWIRSGAHNLAAYGPGWIAAHRDALRVGGLAVGAVFALLLSSWASLFVVLSALAVYQVLITVVARTAAPRPTPPGATAEPAGQRLGTG
jgi:hypothetical protein